MGRGWMFPCSSSPEMQLIPSSCDSWDDLDGIIFGESSRFVGGSLVADAGGGGALFLDVSDCYVDMSFSRVMRCSRGRISSRPSIFLSLFFLFSSPLRIPLSRFSSFCALSISFRMSSNLLLSCCVSFCFLCFYASS